MKVNEVYMVTAVIVYTNLEQLAEAQLWLDRQTFSDSTQIVALDNCNNRFPSAAKALNYGAECAQADVVVFMHQDVYLWDLQSLEKIYNHLCENPDQIIGVAGCTSDGKVFTDIYETKKKEKYGVPTGGKIMEVVTLDECLFAMTKARWSQLRFDEVCCDNWHGYAVDICLSNILQGGQNRLLPLEICHESRGNPRTESFRRTVKNMIDKYEGTPIKRIQGTCVNVRCDMGGYAWYRVKEFVKDVLQAMGILKYWYSWKDKRVKRNAV